MMTIIERDKCCGCHACANACPMDAISMEEDGEGFLYPRIDAERCVDCGRCREVCPALQPPKPNKYELAYACYAADSGIRMTASSGGVFSLLADEMLSRGGVVCGAAFDKEMAVQHVVTDEPEQAETIRGTKYVQSDMGKSFRLVEAALKSGREVLFSGTPCQVAGLKKYLGDEDENLLTVDLICHGVPAPGVWRDYLKTLGGEDPVTTVNFRKKDESTQAVSFSSRHRSGKVLEEPQRDNLYMKGFLQNLYLRSSCFRCPFKGTARCSDLTLGDFWSVSEFHPALADGKGVSAVLIHSQKGKRAIDHLLPRLAWEKATPEEIAVWNECLTESVPPTEKRGAFYAAWHREPLLPLLERLTRREEPKELPGFWTRLKRKIKVKLT